MSLITFDLLQLTRMQSPLGTHVLHLKDPVTGKDHFVFVQDLVAPSSEQYATWSPSNAPYEIGDRVTWNFKIWESLQNGNVNVPNESTWWSEVSAAPLNAETTSNKASNFSVINHTLYPTVQAVEERLMAYLEGIKWKTSVKAATTSNITLSGTQTIDGVAVIAGDRVLVKSQSTGSQNGIYVVASGVWSRSSDASSASELTGAAVVVEQGSSNADTVWIQTADNINLGTSSITFSTFASGVADASETISGKVEEGTDAEVQNSTNTGTGGTGARLFVSIPKLWNWLTHIKTLAHIFAAKITFSVAPRFSSADATSYLKADGNKDLSSVLKIPSSDIIASIETRSNSESTYNLSGAHQGVVVITNNSAVNVFIDIDENVNAGIGATWILRRAGNGIVTITKNALVTIDSPNVVLALNNRFDEARIRKTGLNTYAINVEPVAVGLQDLFIPSGAMWPRATNGCSFLTRSEIATSLLNVQILEFDNVVQQFAQFLIAMPRNWNNGTIRMRAYWKTVASGSGGVVWGFSAAAYSDDDSLSSGFGAEQTVTDTFIAVNDLHITSFTAPITISNSPADGDLIAIQVSRNPSDAADTLAVKARLIGVVIELTTDNGVAS